METVWEVFPEPSENPIGEPATIPQPSSSTISHTNISSTTHHTLSFVSYTTNSYTHSHTTDHLHHTKQHHRPNHNLYLHSRPSYTPNNHARKRQKTLLAPHPQPPPQLQRPRLSTPPHLPSCPRNPVPKGQNNPPRSPSQRETHPHSVQSFPPISG